MKRCNLCEREADQGIGPDDRCLSLGCAGSMQPLRRDLVRELDEALVELGRITAKREELVSRIVQLTVAVQRERDEDAVQSA